MSRAKEDAVKRTTDAVKKSTGNEKKSVKERFVQWLRDLRSELKKVVWPTPKQVIKNALVVLACVVVVGVFIWLFDFVAQFGINSLIGAVKG